MPSFSWKKNVELDFSPLLSVIAKPDFFIVGAPKSGTTAMSDYLSAHPDIFMARKEMHVFGSDLQFGRQFYRRSPAAYLSEFKNRQGKLRAGEASVWYLFSQRAAEEIKAFNPEARILIMLRNPVEMLHSLYYNFCWDGNEHLKTFEAALAAEEERRHGRLINRQTYFVPGLVYRDTIQYTEQVKRYFEVFGRERVRVIIYDEFAADVAAVYNRTLEFLEVTAPGKPLDFKAVNPNKHTKNKFLRALFNDRLVRSAILAARPFMPQALFDAMQKLDARIRRFNSQPQRRPVMNPELQFRLQCEFAPEINRLETLLGRDLSCWSAGNEAFATRQKTARPPSSPPSLLNSDYRENLAA